MAAKVELLQQRMDACAVQRRGEAEAVDAGISDDDLALRFSNRHAGDLRYVATWGRWLIWDTQVWRQDDRLRAFDMARAICREVLAEQVAANEQTEPQMRALRVRLGSASTVAAVTKLASSDPRHAIAPEQLDADPWVLNTPAGILNLRDGSVGGHDPAALCTKITAAGPDGNAPLFEKTLYRVQPDPLVRDYLQRLAGCAMTGSAREHVLPFFFGTGRNGKGTIAHAIRRALGDYGLEIPAEVLMESHSDRHPCELAMLYRVRLAIGSEIDQSKRWNESRLKRLTGGDPITARFIGKDFFEFDPSHTMIMLANSKPGIRSVDAAIKARIHLVPFDVTIPESERDTELAEKLEAEYGGILAWALTGCLGWQANGLQAPESIKAASLAYFEAEDSIAGWMSECCERVGQVRLTPAYISYREWCTAAGRIPLGRNTFADQLEANGIERESNPKTGCRFIGLSLPLDTPNWEPS